MLYIAGPYSPQSEMGAVDKDQHLVQMARHHRQVTNYLMSAGQLVFSPISYGHEHRHVGTDAASWRKFNRHMLRHSHGLVLAPLEGWDTSKGVAMELRWAEEFGLPIYTVDEEYILTNVAGLDADLELRQKIWDIQAGE